MNLFELFVKIGVDDQASGKLKDLGGKLGNGLKTAAKIGTAAVGAAAAGITALTTAAVNNYAEYEQLVGGVDTLFKDASKKVQQYASEAYRTSGMSANDYMANATAFSASLISSLGGDTEKAAEYANRAMVSMSDNANKMGTSLDSIVQTYQSLSRGNMAMLDNLKLGYGGTKAELERLIKDAASYTDIQKEMGITVDASSMSFDNIVNAIAVVQGHLGIAGATAAEAGTTIEGSVNSMKAAWDNLITGVANKNADLEGLINNLVTSIVGDGTESNLGVLGNILPAVKQALNGASKLVSSLLPKIVKEIPPIINNNLPILARAAISIVKSLIDGIKKNANEIIDAIVSVVETIVEFLEDKDNLKLIIDTAIELIIALSEGIVDSLPTLIPAVVNAIVFLCTELTKPENIKKILYSAGLIVVAIANGLIAAIPDLLSGVDEIILNIVTPIGELGSKLWQLGVDAISGLWEGLKEKWEDVKDWFSDKINGLVEAAKDLLGIASPSKVFKKIGGFTAEGFGAGFEDEFAHVKDDMENALNFEDASVGINASIRKVGAGSAGGAFGGTSIGNITINIDGAKYSDEEALADAIAVRIQNMTERRSAVYA